MSLEQEIKLALTDNQELDISGIDWLKPFSDSEVSVSKLVSDYFDTPQLDLIKSGFGLRLRNDNGDWWQTVKATGKVIDGLHQRQEWEWPLAEANFDLELLKQTPIKAAIDDQLLWSQVEKIFTTDFQRQSLQLNLSDGTHVEFAYDKGKVYSNQADVDIHEIELELKSGSLEAMQQLAELCCEHLNVKPNSSSKAKIGSELIS
jgi:triphosphatase